MAQTTLLAEEQLTRKKRPLFRIISDLPPITPKDKISKDIKRDHMFFINSLFCEMIEKI